MLGKRIINTGADACTTDTTQILDAGLTQSEVLYRFEDDVTDTSSSAGKFNKGAIFNGIDTATGRSKIVTSNLPTYNNYSISFWVNSNDLTSSADIVMGTSDNYSGAVGFGIYTGSPNSGDLTWAVCNGSSRLNVTASGLSPKQWHHVVITQNTSNNEKKIYVDNTLKTTSTSTINNTNVTYSLIIGGYQTYNNSALNGKLDQIRVFNKAISASEVTTLYNETTSTVSTLQVLGDTSCIATYTFEGNANDLSTNYNGTASNVRYDYSGTASNITYATGKFDKGAVFNGSNSVIDIENMRTVMGNNFAVSLWVKTPSTFASSGYPAILSMYGYTGSGSAYGWDIEYNNSNKITFYWVSSSGVGNYILSSSLSTDTWYHVVAQKDSSSANLYINGQLDNDSTYGSAYGMYYNNFNRMTIGAKRLNYGSTSGHISGMVDQVRLFTKQLNAGEINSLYNETTTTAASATINNPSTVAYYKMADATDETGSYNLTASNVDFNVQGKYGFAGKFNGTNSYLYAANSVQQPTKNFSVSCWVNFYTIKAASTGIVANFKSGGTPQIGWAIAHQNGTPFQFWADGTASSNGAKAQGTTNPVAGTWYNIVGTYDGTNIKIYVNGSLEGTTAYSATPAQTDQPLVIGRWYGNYNDYYTDGKIDQVRIFNKAISAAEVTTLYNEIQCANTITAPENYFDTKLYTGTGSSQNVTGLNFAPGFVWIKDRSAGNWHNLQDTIRGATKHVYANAANAQDTTSDGLTAFNSDGFTIGGGGGFGNNGNNFVSWNWKAASSNTTNNDGTIASTVRASQESGFSIVTYSPNNTVGMSIGHGLSKAPSLVITKRLGASQDWGVYTNVSTNNTTTNWLSLNDGDAYGSGSYMTIKSTTLELPATGAFWATASSNQVAYCFANIDGYQRIGSYVGTGTPENFIYTGFEPAWVLIKNVSTGSKNWVIADNKRDNADEWLYANDPSAAYDDANTYTKFYANGFSVANNGSYVNTSGDSYIFLAIAANPDTTAPTKANSFNTVTYSNPSTSQAYAAGFKPDFVWFKERNGTSSHQLYDTIRTDHEALFSNTTDLEYDYSNHPSGDLAPTITSTGFTTPAVVNAGINSSNKSYVSWIWKAADHDRNLATINNDGSITSAVSANPAAGFSIVKYKTIANVQQFGVGHGLSSAPQIIIQKKFGPSTTSTSDWYVMTNVIDGSVDYLNLNGTAAKTDMTGAFANFQMGNSTFTDWWTGADLDIINYCFHSVTGYSSIGKYTGNGSTTGPSITVGFRPSWVLIKKTSGTGGWYIFDAARAGSTTAFPKMLYAHLNNAEYDTTGTAYDGMVITTTATTFEVDFSSAWTDLNASGTTYLYMAFK